MDYAVIRIKGSQYKVSNGDEILVDKVGEKEKIEPEVLLVKGEKSVKIGTPIVKGAKVTLKNMGDEKGKKIHVYKYKSKSRYRRKIGSRPKYTRFSVSFK
jgi:large subunit ribosomal protein L21